MSADQLDGRHPRPTMRRDQWIDLDGPWQFAYDDADVGLTQRWFTGTPERFPRQIVVPFPPESAASGIGDTGRHPVLWYRRGLHVPSFAVHEQGRVLLHFGAVDYRAQVWLDGQLVASHVGGQTPFTADLTDALVGREEHVVVVRAEDDPDAVDQPRGKQDWREEPHGIWYARTSGIWQTVWIEHVPAQRIVDLIWIPDVAAGTVRAEVSLSGRVRRPVQVEVTLVLGEEVLAEVSATVRAAASATLVLPIAALRHGQDRARLLWSPESPMLVDARVVLRNHDTGDLVDAVDSYLGLRSTAVDRGSFLLNGQPYYTRAVLDQGFRPRTHLASSGTDELRAEVEQIKAMGFNAVRVHQKAEEPRFLYWADRLGLLVWAETAAAFEFSPAAVDMLVTEWLHLVQRDRSHPSVAVWVPVNESWGVQDIATDPAQQHFARSLAQLTRALDTTRPVVSNEGWEHVDSDIIGVHDYTVDPDQLRARFGTVEAVAEMLTGHGPQGRRPILSDDQARSFHAGRAPLMVTEFGGISLSDADGAWGYGVAGSDTEYAALLMRLFDALRASPTIVGFCYTQFMDTGQETNGLLRSDGTPKLPIHVIHAIVTGRKDPGTDAPGSTFGWRD